VRRSNLTLCSLHWKVVSVYINQMGLVNESLLLHLLEDGEHRRYFGLRTAEHRVIDFECTVHQPAGVRDVDQGRGAAAERNTLSLLTSPWATCARGASAIRHPLLARLDGESSKATERHGHGEVECWLPCAVAHTPQELLC
jgi:hypothetical protein